MLYGREDEQAHLQALAAAAAAGRASSLVVSGEAGVGKSALVEDLVTHLTGFQVLRAQGLESESPLAFAGLHQLLSPLLPLLDRLPAPQARALQVAFGQLEGDGIEPFLIGLATLGLLTEAAETQPMLCVVDDAHWLDSATADALVFAARRLDADSVALLFTARDGDARTFTPRDIPVLSLRGLGAAPARDLLVERSGAGLSDRVTEELLARTEGNPLALVELPATLDRDQLEGRAPLPGQLRLTDTVQRVFLDRCRRLPPEVQTLLLVAAADDTGRLSVVREAAASLGVNDTSINLAEQAGLLITESDTIRVRHPLVRSAVYQAATGHERRSVHRAIAGALAAGEDPDREAWHWALSVEGPDPRVVEALLGVASRAERRGGHSAASAAYERAAQLASGDPTRAQRLYSAAVNAWEAGEAARSRTLLTDARDRTEDRLLRADIDRLRGRLEVHLGSAVDGHRIFVDAARAVAADDPERALEIASAAAALRVYGADSGARLDPAVITGRLDPAAPRRIQVLADLLQCLSDAAELDWAAAVIALRRAAESGPGGLDSDVVSNVGNAALHLGDDETHRQFFASMLAESRQSGAGFLVLYGLHRLAFTQLLGGDWAAVRAGAEEAVALSHAVGERGLAASPMAWLTLLAALQGTSDYDERLAAVQEIAAAHRLGILTVPVRDLTHWAQATRATADSDHVGALVHLRQVATPALQRMIVLDRITAAVRSDDRELASSWLAEFEEFATAAGWPWAGTVMNHGRALLTDGDAATEHFVAALDASGQNVRPYDLARTNLALGEHLRRSQRRSDARPYLRAALAHFEDLGAEPLAARAAHELRASGETARKRDPSTALALTPMELQTAQLGADGLSNKEIAAQLWISPRTVAFHLRNVFTKTGISSRSELARLDLS